ncbi:hypothetical protein SAMD00019534_032860 [Acytostelium subglobosum LB1]|uniref:hypothetical protein n=1 Tax=Acytostelium subglobosum LB1 TaxID=1410327 RepID=UPI000644D155|nr:hypothetical protein SAMD00019534_032860 [Acytostelium subglobosum LB1]GAM20111.1 hypothetical protein SAMD00019534_032860 [Acytostelium subglobosum LB1]|eukprot:XP_012756873.1 hypothetical protein SAMD00019534_032860 [Acytostelium subglobosum LB1]
MWSDSQRDLSKQPLLLNNDSGELGATLSSSSSMKSMSNINTPSSSNNNSMNYGSGLYSRKQPIKRQYKCNDLLFLFLFLGLLGSMAWVSAIAYTRGDPSLLVQNNTLANGTLPDPNWDNGNRFFYTVSEYVSEMQENRYCLLYSVIVAFFISDIWIELLKRFTRKVIYVTIVLGVIILLTLGTFFIVAGSIQNSRGSIIFGGVVTAFSVLFTIILYLMRRSIRLTVATFAESCRGVRQSRSVFFAVTLVVLIFLAFLFYWTTTLIYLFSIPDKSNLKLEDGDGDHHRIPLHTVDFDTKIRYLFTIMSFGFYWTSSFLGAVSQFAIAGAISRWYFSRGPTGKSEVGSRNALASLSLAFSLSMGSIAFGSLMIGWVETLAFLLRLVQRIKSEKKWVQSILKCLHYVFGCLAAIAKWANTYGYAYMSMHGYSYCQSTKACYNVIARNFFTSILMNFIGWFVLLLGKVLVMAISSLVAGIVLYATQKNLSENMLTILLSAIFAYCIANMFSHIIGVSNDTIFVCYLEDLEINGAENILISKDLHELLQENKTSINKPKDMELTRSK